MNELLIQFIDQLLTEAKSSKAAEEAKRLGLERKPGFGNYGPPDTDEVTHRSIKGKLVSVGDKPAAKSTSSKATPQDQLDDPTVKSTSTNLRNRLGVTRAPEGALNLNANSLAQQIKDGIVAPGNDFSKYSEAVSVFTAKYVIDNPDASDEEILEQIVRLDCKSATLTSQVGATIPRKYKKRYQEIEQSGVFSSGCDKEYSANQNRARFMVMITARRKAERMLHAIERTGLEGVSIDSYSGDSESIRSMIDRVSRSDGVIFNEKGKELSKVDVLNFLNGFGKSKFPADTMMIAEDSSGNLIITAFSDKKDLSAIINNSTVGKSLNSTLKLLDSLLESGKVDQSTHERLVREITDYQKQYEEEEDKLKTVTASPATVLIDIIKSSAEAATGLIDKLKNLSGGSNPDKYWVERVEKFKDSAKKKPTAANKRDYLQWLEAAGWDGESEISDETALSAFALRCKNIIESGGQLNEKDQQILLRLEVVPMRELVDQVAEIRNNSFGILGSIRETLNGVTATIGNIAVPLGNLIDGLRAWKGLHLELEEYDGVLSLVAGDVVVDESTLKQCLSGIQSSEDFVQNLEIEEEDIVSKEWGFPTGKSVDVYSVTPEGKRVKVGIQDIRSKDGLLGKLQLTYIFHPEFQKCLRENGYGG